MIAGYGSESGRLVQLPISADVLDGLVWIDLINPSRDEERQLEAAIGLNLPTREEMDEIEQTSRLYDEDGALFMTALIPANTEDDAPVVAPVTFVLTGRRLITIRYHEPKAFALFCQRSTRGTNDLDTGEDVLCGLLDTIVDRLADVLERVGRDIEGISRAVFAKDGAKARRGKGWQPTLEAIGRKGDLISTIRDSLGTLDRMTVFFGQRLRAEADSSVVRARLKDITTDIHSLADHSTFAAQKVTFLLDATLGLIGIEQNAIIKIFSVVSVVFLPPTLVASIYGMNFEVMPELTAKWGYPAALIGMLLSAVLPYLYFKHRNWL